MATAQTCHNATRLMRVPLQVLSRSTSSMPLQPKTPQKRASLENMKQKSLINFFGKPGAKQAGAPTPASKSASSKPVRSKLASSASSDVENRVKDTPPTSDAIDVDMLLDEQAVKSSTRGEPVSSLHFSPHRSRFTSIPQTRHKRKLVIADSDDDQDENATALSKSPVYRTSSPDYHERSSPLRG
jgi:DNA mismatch repair protein MSH6